MIWQPTNAGTMKQDQIRLGAGLWLFAAIGPLLAACSTTWIDNALGLEPAGKRSVAAKPERSAGAAPRGARAAAPPAAPQPDQTLAALPSPTPSAAAAPPVVKLVGLSRDQTSSLLGPPTSERDASPSRVWQYRTVDCALDVYFYFDVSRNDFYALHYGAAGRPSAESADRCLKQVHDARHGR